MSSVYHRTDDMTYASQFQLMRQHACVWTVGGSRHTWRERPQAALNQEPSSFEATLHHLLAVFFSP